MQISADLDIFANIEIPHLNQTNTLADINFRKSSSKFTEDEMANALWRAYERTAFYKNHWYASNIISSTEFSVGALHNLPFLERGHVSSRMLEICCDDLNKMFLFRHRTSGSTGEPITTLMDLEDWNRNLVSIALQIELLGLPVLQAEFGNWSFLHITFYDAGTSVQIKTTLPGTPIWRKINICPTESARTAEKKMHVIKSLFSSCPTILNGMPSVLIHLGELFVKIGIAIPPPIMILTSGERLFQDQREKIESMYQSPTYQIYSSGEAGCIGFECADKVGFHLETHRLFVEPVPTTSDMCEMIITTISNSAMPLIRYRVGDFAAQLQGACPCGDQRPRIGQVFGRDNSGYISRLKRTLL